MFQNSASALRPSTAAGRRDFALQLYSLACAEPERHNWRAVADALHAAMPSTRKALSTGVHSAADVPAWWQDYQPGRQFTAEPVEVTFADGRRVRLSMCSNPGKPANVGRAVRVACLFYRTKAHNALGAPLPQAGTTFRGPAEHVAVPAIAHVEAVDSGETWDAATCSRLTVDVRAGTWCEADARAEAESTAADPAQLRAFRDAHGWPSFYSPADMVRGIMVALFCAAWRAAYGAAENAHRAAMVARHAGCPAPVLAQDPDTAEAWCAAVADGYGAPARAELSGTVAAAGPGIGGTDGAPGPGQDGAGPARAPGRRGRRPAAVPAFRDKQGGKSVITGSAVAVPECIPVEAIGSGGPVKAIGATESEPAADLSTDVWAPSAASHPFVVRCGSKAAREKLFAVVLDGTFPAETGDDGARGGCWRVSAEDAAAARRIARTAVTHSPGA